MASSADLILANRAYADHANPRGEGKPVAGAGGLVAAVGSAIAPWDGERGTLWIGAGRGEYDREFVDADGMEVLETSHGAILHRRLFFDDADWAGHYECVSNSFLWPALHLVRPGLPQRAVFFPSPVVPSEDEWEAYARVNAAFAEAAVASGRRCAWVHDYQLGLVPLLLRQKGFTGPIGFFLHTPFPAPVFLSEYVPADGMARFRAFVEGLLGADVIAVQTERDVAHFCLAARELAGARTGDESLAFERLEWSGRSIRVCVLPVGVNADDVRLASLAELPAEVRSAHEAGLKVVVALERADFTKGIPARLHAVERAYLDGARFAYFGSSSPTREGVDLYDGLDQLILEAAEAAARAAEREGCPFVHRTASLGWGEVVALLGAADVVFTSSLADGMNLVPLQAAIAQEHRQPRGVVIAGRDAGVAHAYSEFEGEGLLVVDPLDVPSMSRDLVDALSGRVPGMSDRFVAAVQDRDASRWATAFMSALEDAYAHD